MWYIHPKICTYLKGTYCYSSVRYKNGKPVLYILDRKHKCNFWLKKLQLFRLETRYLLS